ncbi:MAG: S9 family peptidase [Phycisphaerales bacterium]|nr:S9 family peptidase [Hyphomonadaceae bacterium]
MVASCGEQAARDAASGAGQSTLIARADLFGDPVRHGGQLSPRGDRVAFLAPRDGVQNLWVLSVDAMDEARAVTDDRVRGIRSFYWAQDNATLLYLQDDEGDETGRLYAVDIARGLPRALTPNGARAEVLGVSPNDPGGVIVSLNQRDAAWPDVFRVDVQSGERTLLQRNLPSRGFSRFIVDRENRVRLGVRPLTDGGHEIAARDARGRWTTLLTIAFEDALSSRVIGFETDGRSFLMLDSTGREQSALVRVDAESGVKTPLGENERADVVDVWLDPATNAPEAFATEYLRREWRALDPETQADLDFLDRQLTGDFTVVSRSADNARWIVVEEGPALAARSHLYDRADRLGRRLSSLFRHRPALDNAPLQPMTPVEIEARDGRTLVSYLTLPIGADADGDARPEQPAPLVIVPHGGPWERDSYGFNPLHQWLANRGYAVLSVNFRGSAGLGKSFLNAGNTEWGGRIRDDLADARRWAAANGVAQPDRVAIIGSGFGGYAALGALAFSPEEFRCGASYNGPGNLFAWLDTSSPSARAGLYHRIGDARATEGRDTLRRHSPLFHATQIRAPLLLGVGAREGRGLRGEADQIAQAVRARRGNLTYLLFPDEGRELVRPANRQSYLAVLEHFLGDCLGGRIEPVGASFEGAVMQVYDGAMNVPGLSAFARRPAPPSAEDLPAPNPADGAGGPEGAGPAPESAQEPAF